jgi:hypothetical protein
LGPGQKRSEPAGEYLLPELEMVIAVLSVVQRNNHGGTETQRRSFKR